MRQFRHVVFPALCAAMMTAALPSAVWAADATWREASQMPDVARNACAAQMARRGYEIQSITGGREIGRYVDLRYEAARSGRTLTAVCRYDSGREKVTAVKESKG